MATVPRSFPQNNATNLHDWQEHEATQAYREEQQRFPTPTPQPVGWYAFLGDAHGTAVCDGAKAWWFFPDDGGCMLLHPVDMPNLMRLGQVDLVDQQHVLDQRQGDLARIATTRRPEVQ
jgi:hypothetical protein